MSQKKDCNGWTNYETWAVNLWLNHDQAAYDRWREAARRFLQRAPADVKVKAGVWSAAEVARFKLADAMKDGITDAAPDLGASLYSDLLNAALSEVNWEEIADSFLEKEEEG